MQERTWPLLRPVVESSTTGIPLNDRPARPPVAVMRTRWTRFMSLKPASEGTTR